MKEAKEKKGNGKKKKTGWIIFFVIVFILLVVAIGGYAYVYSVIDKANNVEVDEENLDATENQETINIALYGIDAEDTNSGRSDAIMIFTIDPNMKTCRLCSIMRDSYVNIEGHGMDKINHAYAFGGPELAMKTLNQNFGLNITHFASVDFTTLPVIIDMLGGVDIEITEEEAATGSVPDVYEAGPHTLSGEQALSYSRIRYASGNDFQRTQRQRNVINQIIKKILAQPVTDWPGLASEITPLVTTNYTTNEILSMITQYGIYAKHGMKQTRFPIDGECGGQIIDGVYYLTFDIPKLATKIQDFVYRGIMPY